MFEVAGEGLFDVDLTQTTRSSNKRDHSYIGKANELLCDAYMEVGQDHICGAEEKKSAYGGGYMNTWIFFLNLCYNIFL